MKSNWSKGSAKNIVKSHMFSNSTLALANLIRCKFCNAAIVKMSPKEGGCYGCDNVNKGSCNNKLRISREQLEAIILEDLKEKFLTVENLKYIDTLAGIVREKCQAMHMQSIRMCSYYVAHTSIQTIALLEEENKQVLRRT